MPSGRRHPFTGHFPPGTSTMEPPSPLPHCRAARSPSPGLVFCPWGMCPMHIFSAITPWALDPYPLFPTFTASKTGLQPSSSGFRLLSLNWVSGRRSILLGPALGGQAARKAGVLCFSVHGPLVRQPVKAPAPSALHVAGQSAEWIGYATG